jgi:hypothetical protein
VRGSDLYTWLICSVARRKEQEGANCMHNPVTLCVTSDDR